MANVLEDTKRLKQLLLNSRDMKITKIGDLREIYAKEWSEVNHYAFDDYFASDANNSSINKIWAEFYCRIMVLSYFERKLHDCPYILKFCTELGGFYALDKHKISLHVTVKFILQLLGYTVLPLIILSVIYSLYFIVPPSYYNIIDIIITILGVVFLFDFVFNTIRGAFVNINLFREMTVNCENYASLLNKFNYHFSGDINEIKFWMDYINFNEMSIDKISYWRNDRLIKIFEKDKQRRRR